MSSPPFCRRLSWFDCVAQGPRGRGVVSRGMGPGKGGDVTGIPYYPEGILAAPHLLATSFLSAVLPCGDAVGGPSADAGATASES